MDSVMVDDVDMALITALHVDGRVTFSRAGEVLGVWTGPSPPVRPAARHRGDPAGRRGDPRFLGGDHWSSGCSAGPASALRVAEALAAGNTSWVMVLSGGTEISASVHPGPPTNATS